MQVQLKVYESLSKLPCESGCFMNTLCRAFKVQRPTSLYRHAIELKKKYANAAMYCARRQKKRSWKKNLIAGTNLFSRHRHLRAESFASFHKKRFEFLALGHLGSFVKIRETLPGSQRKFFPTGEKTLFITKSEKDSGGKNNRDKDEGLRSVESECAILKDV